MAAGTSAGEHVELVPARLPAPLLEPAGNDRM
jgi:hypothetical protein